MLVIIHLLVNVNSVMVMIISDSKRNSAPNGTPTSTPALSSLLLSSKERILQMLT